MNVRLLKIEVIDANVHIFKQLKKNKQKKVLFISNLKQKIGVLANIFGIFKNEYDKKRAAHSGCSKLYERIAISEVITLLVEEILESADSKFVTGSFVANNDGSRMGLKHRSSPLVADVAVNDVLKGTSLMVTIANEEHLLGSHHSADTYGESLLGHKVDIVVEEA